MWILYRRTNTPSRNSGGRVAQYAQAALTTVKFECNECEWMVPGTVDPDRPEGR